VFVARFADRIGGHQPPRRAGYRHRAAQRAAFGLRGARYGERFSPLAAIALMMATLQCA
jgi:hypothetical protein